MFIQEKVCHNVDPPSPHGLVEIRLASAILQILLNVSWSWHQYVVEPRLRACEPPRGNIVSTTGELCITNIREVHCVSNCP